MQDETPKIHSWRLMCRVPFLKLPASQRQVLSVICQHRNEKTGRVYMSNDRLQFLTGLARRTIQYITKRLSEQELCSTKWGKGCKVTIYSPNVDRILMLADQRETVPNAWLDSKPSRIKRERKVRKNEDATIAHRTDRFEEVPEPVGSEVQVGSSAYEASLPSVIADEDQAAYIKPMPAKSFISMPAKETLPPSPPPLPEGEELEGNQTIEFKGDTMANLIIKGKGTCKLCLTLQPEDNFPPITRGDCPAGSRSNYCKTCWSTRREEVIAHVKQPLIAPKYWRIKEFSTGWEATGPGYRSYGPYRIKDEAIMAAIHGEAEIPSSQMINPRSPRYVVRDYYLRPGSWVVCDRKREEILSDEDRNLIFFPSKAAAEARVAELENAA